MEYIGLSQAKYALIDDEDMESVSRFRWHVTNHGYVRTRFCMGRVGGKRQQTSMFLHRLIMRPAKHLEIDHINHNPLDCRRANMRICTKAENMHNQLIRKGMSSQYKGVCWYRPSAKWKAQIKHNGKLIYLGYFTNELEAAQVYDAAARELFGEFAKTNF